MVLLRVFKRCREVEQLVCQSVYEHWMTFNEALARANTKQTASHHPYPVRAFPIVHLPPGGWKEVAADRPVNTANRRCHLLLWNFC